MKKKLKFIPLPRILAYTFFNTDINDGFNRLSHFAHAKKMDQNPSQKH